MRFSFWLHVAALALLLAGCRAGGAADHGAGRQDTLAPRVVRGTGPAAGMVWIPGGTFLMGTPHDRMPSGPFHTSHLDETPQHPVRLDGFWLDTTEATNSHFARFVRATGYTTQAEKPLDWAQLQRQLPPGTPRPPDSLLAPGSLVFAGTNQPVALDDPAQWWRWTPGASWQHPEGPASTIEGRERFPAVHLSWDDARAFCAWQGKRLPSEAEWERAARGGGQAEYPWGSAPLGSGAARANTWEGGFPYENTQRDGFVGAAPVGQYAPNAYGLYDVAGNVWEWTGDWYRSDTYALRAEAGPEALLAGPASGFDAQEPLVAKRVERGGSFLCNGAYCAGYRVATRQKGDPFSSYNHVGVRCAADFNPPAQQP